MSAPLSPHPHRENYTLSAIVAAPSVAALAGAFEGYVHPGVSTLAPSSSSTLVLHRSRFSRVIAFTRGHYARNSDFVLDWGTFVLGGAAQLAQSVPYLSGVIGLGLAILNIVKAMKASQEQCLELVKQFGTAARLGCNGC